MKIKKFKKVGQGKYKVYLEDGKVLTLFEDVIVNNNLIIKKEIDDEMFKKLEKENNFASVKEMCINYISLRIRSTKEIKDYLKRKNVDVSVADEVIFELDKMGLINDFSFAKAYVNDQILLTPKGPYKISKELENLGITNDVINEALDEIDNDALKEKLEKLVIKQLKIKKGSPTIMKLKLLNYFYNLGYSKEMTLSVIDTLKIGIDLDHLKKEYDKLKNKYKNKVDDS